MGAIHVHVRLARPLLAYCVEGAGHETAFKFNMQSTPAIFTVSIAIMVCMCDEHTSLHTHVHAYTHAYAYVHVRVHVGGFYVII